MAVIAACGGGSSAPLADAESGRRANCVGYDHVYVTVQRVRVLQQLAGVEQWTEVALTAPRRIDLMNSGGLLQALGAAPLAAGHYTEVRLIVAAGDDASLANAAQPIGGSEAALNVPSGAQDGLKLMGDFVVPTGQTGDVVLSGFDACQAVTQAGNSGKYNLKPELTASVQLAAVAEERRIASGKIEPLIGGGYVVSRKDRPNVYALQRYGADGQPAGSEAIVAVPVGPQDYEAVTRIAPLTGGGYAVVWMKAVVSDRNFEVDQIFTQSFTAAGTPIGSPVPIAQVSFGRELYIVRAWPQIGALTGGGYAVAWTNSTTDDPGLRVQRFNPDGTPAGVPQNVAPFGRGYLGVTGLSNGGYLVTWSTGASSSFDGGARAYSSTDVPLGPVHTAGPSWGRPAEPEDTGPGVTAALAGGGAVLVWHWHVVATAWMQQLAPDGTPLTSARSVDGTPSIFARHAAPSAAGLPDGGYVVAWIEAGEVHALRFAADGTPAGAETRINLVTTLPQGPTTVVPMAGGGFMITWSGIGADGTRGNYARVFPANGLLGTP